MWFPSAALAQSVELPEEDPLVSLRLRSMGGAATAVAESAAANLENPAAIGVRRSLADPARLDPDLTLQARDHPLLAVVFGHPDAPYRRSYAQVAGNLRMERTGFGFGWREVRVSDGDSDVGTFLGSAGVAYAGGTFVAGLMPHVFGFQADVRGMAVTGGATGGVLWAPAGSLRFGASARTPMKTPAIRGPGPVSGRLPFEGQAGLTWTPGFENTRDRWGPGREHTGDGSAALLTAELVVTGPSGDARVLAEGDLSPETSDWTVSPRGGGEWWGLDDHLRLRGGAGYLAGRGGSPAEVYGTAGVAYQVVQDPRGFGWRAVVGGEWFAVTGPAVGIGLETW